MTTINQSALNRAIAGTKNIAGHHHNATERGREISENLVRWVARWGYVSGPLLALFLRLRFDTKRPKIASEFVGRGLLETIDIPADEQEKLGGILKVYRVSKAAYPDDDSLPGYRSKPPHWDSLAHSFMIQEFAIRNTAAHPFSDDWLSELECHQRCQGRRHAPTPDLVFLNNDNLEVWIEIEKTSKRGKRRDLMVTQYEYWFRQEERRGLLGSKIGEVWIIVPSVAVAESYLREGFGAEAIQPVDRDRKGGYDRSEDAWPIHPRRTFGDAVKIWYYNDQTNELNLLEVAPMVEEKNDDWSGTSTNEEEISADQDEPVSVNQEPDIEPVPVRDDEPEITEINLDTISAIDAEALLRQHRHQTRSMPFEMSDDDFTLDTQLGWAAERTSLKDIQASLAKRQEIVGHVPPDLKEWVEQLRKRHWWPFGRR